MPTATGRAYITFWHFHCPECGIGDREAGYHASYEALWCDVCMEEGRHVRLKRWPVEESGLPPGGDC